MLIDNKQEFDNFTQNVLPPLGAGEVYFVSLSARNKYLTDGERKFYGLGRTEMFARTLVRSVGDWPRVMRRLEGELETRLTKTGVLVPKSAVVVYVNVNPSSSVAAHLHYTEQMQKEIEQLMLAMQRNKTPNMESFTFADKRLLDAFQTSVGNRYYLDVDVDTKDVNCLRTLTDNLNDHGVQYHVVETHGGFHVLVVRESLNGTRLRLDLVVKQLATVYNTEVMFNKNGMLPMPGTLHAGFPVTVKKVW